MRYGSPSEKIVEFLVDILEAVKKIMSDLFIFQFWGRLISAWVAAADTKKKTYCCRDRVKINNAVFNNDVSGSNSGRVVMTVVVLVDDDDVVVVVLI